MEQTPDNYFTNLAKIDVGEYIERKGKFSYLSWPYAVKTLRETDPTATWEVIRHNGMPYMETGCGYFVEVAVTCHGITLSQIHPVLDNNNRPITQPNAFQINTSIQRALVKAIALHGLGLYIYAGEDLPEGAEEPKEPKEPKEPGKEPPKEEVKAPASLRAKYQMWIGSMDKFETWYSSQKEKFNDIQIERFLTTQIQKKTNQGA